MKTKYRALWRALDPMHGPAKPEAHLVRDAQTTDDAIRPLVWLMVSAAVCLGAIAWSEGASASGKGMRCGNHLIRKGALQEEVLARCGRPYSRARYDWLYRKGNTVYRVRFNAHGVATWVQSEIRY